MYKAEERIVLDRIAELIASTGEESYISMAFKGCVKMASDNIDNDWGCSPTDYLDKANALQTAYNELTEELTAVKEQRDTAKAALAELKNQMPTNEMKNDIFTMLLECDGYYLTEKNNAALDIVKYADNPEDERFQHAVYRHRAFSEKANKCDMLTDYLKSI